MLSKLLSKKKEKGEPFLSAGGTLSVHIRDEMFWVADQPLKQLNSEEQVLKLFLDERISRNAPLEASYIGDRVEVSLLREEPARRYVLTVNPHRSTIGWIEELLEPVDQRLPRLGPTWSRTIGHPPWPVRAGRTTISATFVPEGLLLLLGDWVTWLDGETGQVRGEWPMPGKRGTKAAVDLLAATEHGLLGSYRAFHETMPPVAGMLFLKFDGQPRWKLIPAKDAVHLDVPLESSPELIVVEGRLNGDDGKPRRAQWVVDLAANKSYTANLGGLPQDAGVERCLSLAPHRPNQLEFHAVGEELVATDPRHKLTHRLVMPSASSHPDRILSGALWDGRAIAYELCPQSLRLHFWQAEGLGKARCSSCQSPVPNRAYHCQCGRPWVP